MIMTSNERIYAVARRYQGVCEIPGPKSNKLIQGWIKQAADWLDPDDSKTPWCGCFRGDIGLETGTGVPHDHYRAAAWLNWGTAVTLEDALQGDTVVLRRSGGQHVTILDHLDLDGRTFHGLGGNQSDKVCIHRFACADILGIRRAR